MPSRKINPKLTDTRVYIHRNACSPVTEEMQIQQWKIIYSRWNQNQWVEMVGKEISGSLKA